MGSGGHGAEDTKKDEGTIPRGIFTEIGEGKGAGAEKDTGLCLELTEFGELERPLKEMVRALDIWG